MPRRSYYDSEDDDGRYRLRERGQSSCATGSCSEYGNYLTVRPDFPSRNDIRNRKSYYNRNKSDIDVIYESKSYPYLDPSVRATRQNSVFKEESSELVPLVDSRDIGADSHFIQSRLGIQRKKNVEYVYTRKGKYVRNRTDSESSFERYSPERIRVSPVREAKEWLGPLDKASNKPFKIKVSKLRSSPERSSSNNHFFRTSHSKSPSPRAKLHSRSTSPIKRFSRSPSPEQKKRMTRSTSPFDLPTKNPKLKKRSSPPKSKRNLPESSESDLKIFPLMKKRRKSYETKIREKRIKEEIPQISPKSSPPRASPGNDSSSDDFPSHRRDTIASRLKQKQTFKYPIPFVDSSYIEEEVDSKYIKKKIERDEIHEKAAELIEIVKKVVEKPERRRTKYFDSNLKVGREGKMRKLDVSSDCKVVCDDKKPKKRMNFGKKYGRYAYEPHRDNKYLSESKDKMKTRKSTEKDRVSFKEPETPEIKRSSFKLTTSLLKKRSNMKKKLKKFQSTLSPPEESLSLEKATQSEIEPEKVKKEETPKKFEKTLSEDSTKKFYHKTVLENYPDETDHLRNYHEEFRKEPFTSALFNPTDHTPPVTLPSVYPNSKKQYDYSGLLEPETKRKPSSTTYIKREPRKELGHKSKIGESFFDLNNKKNTDRISEEVLTKSDMKETNEKKDIDFRPISLASLGEEEEITMPDNEVVSTILETEEPQDLKEKPPVNPPEPRQFEKDEKISMKKIEHIKPEKRRKIHSEEKEKQKDWRFRKKVDYTELKMLGRKPSEVELASDERLVPDIVGHAAMHNWEQAENYHLSRNKYKMYVPRIVKRQQARERRAREMELEEEQEEEILENEKTENIEEAENKEEEEEVVVKRPTPKKRFRGKRINPRSRFDGGYDLLQVADSETSVEMEPSGSRLFVMPKPEKKKEGTISKFAKRLFSSKRNEESKEDLENSILKTQNSKPPKRKVSFSFPPNQ